MRRFTSLTVLTVLLLLVTAALGWGQTAFTVQMIASEGGTTVDTMVLGVNASATYGIDAGLGEYELPPFPFDSVAAARFIDLTGHTELGQGVRTDIRTMYRTSQTDTYHVAFRTRPDNESGNMTFTWPADLATKGGGSWRMVDVFGGALGLDLDMTATTTASLSFATYSAGGNRARFYIIKSDETAFRSFTYDTLALDADAKGKIGKPIKPAPYRVDFSITIPNASGSEVSKLHIEWGTDIINGGELEITPEPLTVTPDAKFKKYDIVWEEPISPDGEVTISGLGNKGKQIKAKYWWLNGTTIVGTKIAAAPTAFSTNTPQFPMPNSVNGGIEAMTALFVKPNALIVGVSTANEAGEVHAVSHAKYNDVLKTLTKKGVLHTGDPRCLDYFFKDGAPVTTKPIKKLQKALPLDKHNNILLAEALTLKMNIAFSDAGVNPSGFGDLMVFDDASAFNTLTVDEIAAEIDTYLACGYDGELTGDDYLDIAQALNAAFSSELDTISWASTLDKKNGDPKFTGGVSIAEISWLSRSSAAVAQIRPTPEIIFSEEQPDVYELSQNYPNPFNPSTTIEFNLVEDAFVTVKIYNMLGQEVATLVNGEAMDAGWTSVDFDASHLPSGVYLYRMVAVNAETGAVAFQEVRKMAFVK